VIGESRQQEANGHDIKNIVAEVVKQTMLEISFQAKPQGSTGNKKTAKPSKPPRSTSCSSSDENSPPIQTSNKMYAAMFQEKVKELCCDNELSWKETSIGTLEKDFPKKVSFIIEIIKSEYHFIYICI